MQLVGWHRHVYGLPYPSVCTSYRPRCEGVSPEACDIPTVTRTSAPLAGIHVVLPAQLRMAVSRVPVSPVCLGRYQQWVLVAAVVGCAAAAAGGPYHSESGSAGCRLPHPEGLGCSCSAQAGRKATGLLRSGALCSGRVGHSAVSLFAGLAVSAPGALQTNHASVEPFAATGSRCRRSGQA